ncbi:MAG: hypothetical protein AAF697_13710 [Pseudomonadota bacterium]
MAINRLLSKALTIFGAIFAALLLVPTAAHAAWHKAESDRFVIYSDSRADDLVDFAEMLERYHLAMELESGRTVPRPSPSNRLTIYMVGSIENLRKVYGRRNSNVAGFYIPRANGSITIVPNIRIGGTNSSRSRTGSRRAGNSGAFENHFSLTVLLHEYAHHFFISSARHAMPLWLSEGSAEYFAATRFNRDGSIDIGMPNNTRAYEISQAAPVSLIELLDYATYRENRGNRYDAFYGRSWLLFHYLAFNPERRGQLETYWTAVGQGMDSLEAGRRIFGDLDQLERELRDYGRSRSMSGMRYPATAFSVGEISVERLSEGHAEMMDVIVVSKRGVNAERAQEILPRARDIAAKYPDDAAVLEALAEAEYDAGNDDAAIDAATRAIAIDPRALNAYVQKGYALFRQAREAEDQDAAYTAAMAPFEALNALEADHTQPLIYYYRSFAERGVEPPEGAKFALERATQLAPFDLRLAMDVAAMKARDGDAEIARYLLGPVAADPHGGGRAAQAQAMIAYLERIPQGQRVDLYAVVRPADEGNESVEGEDE